MRGWIPVEEALPEEHENFSGGRCLFSASDLVLVTVEKDGIRTLTIGRTMRGKWNYREDVRVVAWMPCQGPYMEDKR